MPSEGLSGGVLGGSGASWETFLEPWGGSGELVGPKWPPRWFQEAAKWPKVIAKKWLSVVFGAGKWPQELISHQTRHKRADAENLKIDHTFDENAGF